jgi:hypothetical protein
MPARENGEGTHDALGRMWIEPQADEKGSTHRVPISQRL